MFNEKLPLLERLLICLLGAYLLVSFALYIHRLVVITKYPYELSKGVEGVLLNETIKIINGQPIYTNMNDRPYLIANYPPLYQVFCASIMKLTGDRTLFTGRAVSSLASLCAGAFIFLAAFKRAGLKATGFSPSWYFTASGIFSILPRITGRPAGNTVRPYRALFGGKARRLRNGLSIHPVLCDVFFYQTIADTRALKRGDISIY